MYHDILPNFSITPSQVKLVKETSVVMFHIMDFQTVYEGEIAKSTARDFRVN